MHGVLGFYIDFPMSHRISPLQSFCWFVFSIRGHPNIKLLQEFDPNEINSLFDNGLDLVFYIRSQF